MGHQNTGPIRMRSIAGTHYTSIAQQPSRLHSLVGLSNNESEDVVIGKMLPEFAALIVQLGSELNAAQQKVVRLTRALFWLTTALVVVGVVRLVVTIDS